MAEDVILNKAASIERYLNLVANLTKQDAIILNLQRACDLTMYVSQRKLGVPQDSRNAFTLLQTSGIIPIDLATRMQHMVGFRMWCMPLSPNNWTTSARSHRRL